MASRGGSNGFKVYLKCMLPIRHTGPKNMTHTLTWYFGEDEEASSYCATATIDYMALHAFNDHFIPEIPGTDRLP